MNADEGRGLTTRQRWIPVAVIAFYLLGLAVLAATGHFGFIFKTAIIPALLLVAILTKRVAPFVRDWGVFLALVLLFDSVRGLIYSLTTYFGLPVYMGYVIDAERALFGEVPSITLQRLWYDPPVPGMLEKLLVVVHGSHFVFFLFFALVMWIWRPEAFGRFKAALLLTLGLGLLGYFALPTVPPWMAANEYAALPPIHPIRAEIYNFVIPDLHVAFNTNPIAAMPSLHTALPVLFLFVTIRHFRRWILPVALYLGAVLLSLLYLGEHYVVDILAGVAVAAVAYGAAYHWVPRWRGRALAGQGGNEVEAASPALTWRDRPVQVALMLSLAIIIVSESTGHVSDAMVRSYPMPRSFIEREMVGRSKYGHYMLGIDMYDKGEFAGAQRELALSLDELPAGKKVRVHAQRTLGHAAYKNGDDATVVAALGALPLGMFEKSTDGVMLGVALMRGGELERGLRTLALVAQRFPEDPAPLFWATWFRRKAGVIGDDLVRRAIADLGRFAQNDETADLKRRLLGLIDDAR